MRIALRFNAGIERPKEPVPKGRLKTGVEGFSRPFGTSACGFVPPSVETQGYCQMSLRDKSLNEFLEGHYIQPAFLTKSAGARRL